jgi:uncharacterized protein (TIGR04255 family)
MADNLNDICYQKNYLSEVIIRLDFSVPILEISKKLNIELNNKIMRLFPISEPHQALEQELQISPATVKQNKKEFIEWVFYDKERSNSIKIIPTSIILLVKRYTTFESLLSDFLCITEEFNRIYPFSGRRLGLRYINDIELREKAPFVWSDYLNPKMLCLFNFVDQNQYTSRIFHNIEFTFDSMRLRYQFGMHNPDYPSPIRKKEFILDLDAFNESLIEFNDISNSLQMFHGKIQEMFELSITDKLRERMNER